MGKNINKYFIRVILCADQILLAVIKWLSFAEILYILIHAVNKKRDGLFTVSFIAQTYPSAVYDFMF
ncbi:hypothetical protein AMS62_13870 [Bacillus sp. FJAT-18019]|nr:hypothetical protein AMS62_13870 [Bacillus sp. FJAT-18019]